MCCQRFPMRRFRSTAPVLHPFEFFSPCEDFVILVEQAFRRALVSFVCLLRASPPPRLNPPLVWLGLRRSVLHPAQFLRSPRRFRAPRGTGHRLLWPVMPRQSAAARQTTKTDRLSHSYHAAWLRLCCPSCKMERSANSKQPLELGTGRSGLLLILALVLLLRVPFLNQAIQGDDRS